MDIQDVLCSSGDDDCWGVQGVDESTAVRLVPQLDVKLLVVLSVAGIGGDGDLLIVTSTDEKVSTFGVVGGEDLDCHRQRRYIPGCRTSSGASWQSRIPTGTPCQRRTDDEGYRHHRNRRWSCLESQRRRAEHTLGLLADRSNEGRIHVSGDGVVAGIDGPLMENITLQIPKDRNETGSQYQL